MKIGDRVVMIKDFEDRGKGLSGKLIAVQENYGVIIEFDKAQPWALDGGRVSGDCTRDDCCWIVKDSDWKSYFKLEKIIKKTDFKPGGSIDAHVSSLLKECEDEEQKKWLKTFQNCVLPAPVKAVINEALTVILCKEKFDEWGINEHFEKGLTNSILIYGPPGTGKTMISESFAAVLCKNLMKIDSAVLQSNIPGQTERNIKKAFEEAEEKDCVLLFDECDSLLSSRELVGVILAAEINCLLTEIERFSGVVILTTNRVHRLDAALSRRIVAKIELGLPDIETRSEIWRKLMPPKMPLAKDIDYTALAEHPLSGGDIKNVILLAARKAIAKNAASVCMQDLLDSLLFAKEGSDKFKPQQKYTLKESVKDAGFSFKNYLKGSSHASF